MKHIFTFFYLQIILLIWMGSSSTFAQSIRKNYREMTDYEKQVYCNALNVLKANSTIANYANLHSTLFGNGIHQTDLFLPWHRWLLRNFENALRGSGVSGASKISIPYWDWTSQYYPTAPTDASTSAPLWSNTFLGQYNSAWGLNRQLGSASLPTLSAVNSTQAISTYASYWSPLENSIHNSPHVFVSGVMGGGASPGDPVFYLHHNMIDKLWQNWIDAGHTSTYAETSFNYSGNDLGFPGINPQDVKDGRNSTLKVWYAENNQVNLNTYTVQNTENYNYTGKIVASFFTAPSATTCNFTSATSIVLGSGFRASAGSNFSAVINVPYFNNSRLSDDQAYSSDNTQNNYVLVSEDLINIYPNPSQGEFNLDMSISGNANFTWQVSNMVGEIILTGKEESNIVQLNLSGHAQGIYTLKMDFEQGNSIIKKLVLK